MHKKSVFDILAFFMMGFGMLIGIVFPFFVLLITKVSSEVILTPIFFSLCIFAGLLVGLFNIFLAKNIVGKKLCFLSDHMRYVQDRVNEKTKNQDVFNDDNCYIKIDSEDIIGESAKSFNSLVKALVNAFNKEEAVKTFSQMLSSRLDLEQLADNALTSLIDNFNASGGIIIVEQEGDLKIIASLGMNHSEQVLKNNLVWDVMKKQKSLLVELPENISLTGVIVDYRPKAVLIEPIIYKDTVLGIVILATVVDFTEDMKNNIKMFGQGLALAFKNAIAHDQLQRLAANDPLTGIFNRRFGLSRLKEEFSRAIRTNTPIGVIIFDIDHFKKVNDTYGHIIGDKILVNLARVAKTVMREGDIFLRYGGEEFLVVLPGASLTDVSQIGERLRRIVEDTEVHNNLQAIKITISLGGSSYPEQEAESHLSIINNADKKLYQAKENGRNKLVV